MPQTVLVTGGSGFLGVHAILQLLEAGYTVRTTVRSMHKEPEVRAMLQSAGMEAADRLTFFPADLTRDEGWAEAAQGCDYVLHVASPFPLSQPKNEDDLIIPAREGTLRVLSAARDAGVKRVVVTSSFAAIGYGHPESQIDYTEQDWTNLQGPNLSAYVKSKTIAEQAAWDWLAREGGTLELAVVNPVGVFGPVLGPVKAEALSGSISLLKQLIDGAIPFCPDISFGIVDVRDTIDLHLRTMIDPAASGHRFLAVAGEPMSIKEISALLKQHLGPRGKRLPTRGIPSPVLRFVAKFVPKFRNALPELGRRKRPSNAKARSLLGWQPRTSEEAILATAESLMHLNLLKP